MKKYYIEGGIDFFSELYKSLDNEENNCKTDEDDNLCLITNQPLVDKFVKMECGHKFNYIPLFNDLVNHKKKFNNMEGSTTHLKINEIRCPYCRKKSTGVLPYYTDLGLAKITGVNYIDINYKPVNEIKIYTEDTNHYSHCEFLTPNVYFNPNSENIKEVYKANLNIEECKFIKCKFMGTQITHFPSNYMAGYNGDEKYYCWNHKKIIIKKYKKEISDKAKEEKKILKLKEKENIKKAKEEVKQKEKDEKQKIKDELKKIIKNAKINKQDSLQDDNNVVLGLSNVDILENVEVCLEIIKTGPKKGMQCGLKNYENNLCKRHYNLNNKNIVIV
jgi:hypothetical protein